METATCACVTPRANSSTAAARWSLRWSSVAPAASRMRRAAPQRSAAGAPRRRRARTCVTLGRVGGVAAARTCARVQMSCCRHAALWALCGRARSRAGSLAAYLERSAAHSWRRSIDSRGAMGFLDLIHWRAALAISLDLAPRAALAAALIAAPAALRRRPLMPGRRRRRCSLARCSVRRRSLRRLHRHTGTF